MRIYTEVNFQWDDKKGKLVEVSSESFNYNGEMAMCGEKSWKEYERWDSAGNKFTIRLKGQKYVGSWKTEYTEVQNASGAVVYSVSKDHWGTEERITNGESYIKGTAGGWGDTKKEQPLKGEIYDSLGESQTAFELKYNFKQSEDSSKTQAFILGTSSADFDEAGAFTGSNPWTKEFDPTGDKLAEKEFDPTAVATIKEKLNEFQKIITAGEADPDMYEEEVINAVRDLDVDMGIAADAFERFDTALGREWGVYEASVKDIEGEWATGDTWDDKNKDGIVDAGELTESDGIEGLTPPGTHVQEAFKKYGLAEDPLAIKRETALADLTKKFGDPFVDDNNNNIWDLGETWGKEWVDKNNDNLIQADELTGAVAGEEPATGTDVGKAQADYAKGYISIFGTKGSEDKGYTYEEAKTEGIIIEQDDGTYEYEDGSPAPLEEDWVEGSYYRGKRLAGETADIGYRAKKTTREGALESLRTEAKEKIRSADAKRGAAGFAATSVGGTARDALAREIGKEARGIEEAHTEGRELIKITYEEDIKGAETAKRIGTTDPGGIEDVRDTLLEGYYDENKTSRESAVSGYKTSEAVHAAARDQALTDAAANIDPKTGLIPEAQYSFETTAEGYLGGWKTASDVYSQTLRDFGSPAGADVSDLREPFEVTGKLGQAESVQTRATDKLRDLAFGIETTVGAEVERLEYEDFDFWGDKRSPFLGYLPELQAKLPWTPGEEYAGQFPTDLSGLFDPGDIGTYDPSPTMDAWLYQPGDWGGYKMPWEEEDYTGTWDPFGQ